jgi:hypothetical protein
VFVGDVAFIDIVAGTTSTVTLMSASAKGTAKIMLNKNDTTKTDNILAILP